MRKTSLLTIFLITSIISFYQNKKDNKPIIYFWKGKIVTKQQQLDSIKYDYIYYVDSLKSRKKL